MNMADLSFQVATTATVIKKWLDNKLIIFILTILYHISAYCVSNTLL